MMPQETVFGFYKSL